MGTTQQIQTNFQMHEMESCLTLSPPVFQRRDVTNLGIDLRYNYSSGFLSITVCYRRIQVARSTILQSFYQQRIKYDGEVPTTLQFTVNRTDFSKTVKYGSCFNMSNCT